MFDFDIIPLSAQVLGTVLPIFSLRITDVATGTVPTTMILRYMRKWAMLIGFVEVTIWVVAISQVITHLDSIWNILAYSGGFATGTLVGMWIEDKMALGSVIVHVISMAKGAEIAEKVRAVGYGATELQAQGKSSPVSLIGVVVPRERLAQVIRLVNAVDATSFVTEDDTRQVVRGHQQFVK